MIIGLDSADPRIVLGSHAGCMPGIGALARSGAAGAIRSTFPPITVPAWVTMTTGLCPGSLGLYGFHERIPGSYGRRLSTSSSVRAPRIWDLAGRHGLRSIVLGVPLTWPPPGEFEGALVTDFPDPCGAADLTAPASLRGAIEARFGPVARDTGGFRGPDREGLEARILETSSRWMEIAGWLADREDWDLLMVVDMGMDRFQHAFLRKLLPDHPAWRAAGRADRRSLEEGRRFLAAMDSLVAGLASRAGGSSTVMVVSDHGARSLEGGFALNDWLAREGWLAPDGHGGVDWKRTVAWAEGGYVGRVNLNLEGREPSGIVRQGPGAGALIREISDRIRSIDYPDGRPMRNRAILPADAYPEARGLPPDLMVELDGLALRALATTGLPGLVVPGNDTGADDANHDHEGLIVMAGPGIRPGARIEGAGMEDVAPTVCAALGIEPPAGCRGRDLVPLFS